MYVVAITALHNHDHVYIQIHVSHKSGIFTEATALVAFNILA